MRTLILTVSILITLSSNSYAQDTVYLKKYAGNLKKVDITISDSLYSFLFDTGGGETFISPTIAKNLGKEVYGNATMFRMSGEMLKYQKCDSVLLKADGIHLYHSTVGVWDLMSILPAGLPQLDGVLSLKSFSDRVVTLDLMNNRLILESPTSYKKQVVKKKLLNSRFANGLDGNELSIFLDIKHKNRSYWFLFDSGNLSDLLLSHNTAIEWGLLTDTTSQRKELGALTIDLGRKNVSSNAAAQTIIYAGALNYDILSKKVFLIDFTRKKMWSN